MDNIDFDIDARRTSVERFADNYLNIQTSVFEGDSSECVTSYEEYVESFDALSPFDKKLLIGRFLWAYKWIMQAVYEFLSVPKARIEAIFEDFKARLAKENYSLRPYYMKLLDFYRYSAPEKLKDTYESYVRSKRDALADCHACEIDEEVRFALVLGEEERAKKAAVPLFKNRFLRPKKSCAEVPQLTYGAFMSYYLKRGNLEEAEKYAKLVYPMIEGKDAFLENIGNLLELYALTDTAFGLKIWDTHYVYFEASKNEVARFYFMYGASKLFDALAEAGSATVCFDRLPQSYPNLRENCIYPTKELAEYFSGFAAKIGQKLDARNEYPYFKNYV